MEDVKVGDTVRSFDFPNIDSCYAEGVVEEIVMMSDCDHYKIKVQRYVVEEKEETDIPDYVYPPVNGVPTWFGGVTKGVKKI